MSRKAMIKGALDVASSMALIVACGAFVWTVFFRESAATRAGGEPVEALEGLRLDAVNATNVVGHGPVAIVEFSDFQCPFCIKHANEVLPRLKDALITSGKARYVALHFPIEQIHPLALKAGEAAECAGKQDRFWEMRRACSRILAASIQRIFFAMPTHFRSTGMHSSAVSKLTRRLRGFSKIARRGVDLA
jgi:hypothetical protein